MAKEFKVGDHVQLNNNPWDEQISEELERYYEMKDKAQTVTEIKDVSHLEGTSGQWIKTDMIEDWTDSAWFKEPDLAEVLLGFCHKLASKQKDLPPDIAKHINDHFEELL